MERKKTDKRTASFSRVLGGTSSSAVHSLLCQKLSSCAAKIRIKVALICNIWKQASVVIEDLVHVGNTLTTIRSLVRVRSSSPEQRSQVRTFHIPSPTLVSWHPYLSNWKQSSSSFTSIVENGMEQGCWWFFHVFVRRVAGASLQTCWYKLDDRRCFAGMQNLFEMHKKSNFVEEIMHSGVLQVFYICFSYGLHKKKIFCVQSSTIPTECEIHKICICFTQ